MTYPGNLPFSVGLTSAQTPYYQSFHGTSQLDNAMNQKYGFDVSGRVTQAIPVNTTLDVWANTQYRYDGLDRLSSVREQNIASGALGTTCPSDTTYGYQCAAAPTAGDTLTYDGADNLSGGSVNGVSVAATYGTGDRPTSLLGVSHTFDQDGNVTTSGGRTFFWRTNGLLDSVRSGSVTLEYDYGPSGQLAKRSRNGAVERLFFWDGDLLLAELDGTGSNRIGEYVYEPQGDVPIAFVDGNQVVNSVSYYLQGADGNVIGLVRADSAGAQSVRSQYQYGDFGTPTAVVDSLANRLRWKGLIWEGDSTRLYYVHERWYDPQQGRFMSEDAAGTAGSTLNPYVYSHDDPINGRDLLGEKFDDSDCWYWVWVDPTSGDILGIFAGPFCDGDGEGYVGSASMSEPAGANGPPKHFHCPPLPPNMAVPNDELGRPIDMNQIMDEAYTLRPLGFTDKKAKFSALVTDGGPWDWKSHTTDPSEYRAFGDFSFGMEAYAAGYSEVGMWAGAGMNEIKDNWNDTSNGGGGIKSLPQDWRNAGNFFDDSLGHAWASKGWEWAKANCKLSP
jgi:RHS repeat-associated protein